MVSVVVAGRGYLGRLKRFWVQRGLAWVAFLAGNEIWKGVLGKVDCLLECGLFV